MWMRTALLFMMLSLSACTWVNLTKQGEEVKIATKEDVSSCKQVGKTTVTTLSKLAGMNRYDESMQDELNKLARNSAVDLKGDTVVPITPIEDGHQTFAVFRCQPTAAE